MMGLTVVLMLLAGGAGYASAGILGSLTGMVAVLTVGSSIAVALGEAGTNVASRGSKRRAQRIGGFIGCLASATGAYIGGWEWGWVGAGVGYVVGILSSLLVPPDRSEREGVGDDDAESLRRAEDIVSAYGEVMIERGELGQNETDTQKILLVYFASPISLLRDPVPDIKEAIKLYLTYPQDTSMCDSLINGFSELSHYIPDSEYEEVATSLDRETERSRRTAITVDITEKTSARERLLFEELQSYAASLPSDLPHVAYVQEQLTACLKVGSKQELPAER